METALQRGDWIGIAIVLCIAIGALCVAIVALYRGGLSSKKAVEECADSLKSQTVALNALCQEMAEHRKTITENYAELVRRIADQLSKK